MNFKIIFKMNKINNEILLDIKEKDLLFSFYKIEGANFKDLFYISSYIKKNYKNIDYSIYSLYLCLWKKDEKKINKIGDINIFNKKVKLKSITHSDIRNYNYVKNNLLQKLIIQSIKNRQNGKWRHIKENVFMSHKKEIVNIYKDNLEIYKKLILSCKINDSGDIYLSFKYCIYVVSLESIDKINKIEKGTYITDINSFSKLIYEDDSDYKYKDIIPDFNKSLKNILKEKDIIKNKITKINDNDILVNCSYPNNIKKNNKDYIYKTYLFPKPMLRLYRNNYLLKKDFNEKYEIDEAIQDVKYILRVTEKFGNVYISKNNEYKLIKSLNINNNIDTNIFTFYKTEMKNYIYILFSFIIFGLYFLN